MMRLMLKGSKMRIEDPLGEAALAIDHSIKTLMRRVVKTGGASERHGDTVTACLRRNNAGRSILIVTGFMLTRI